MLEFVTYVKLKKKLYCAGYYIEFYAKTLAYANKTYGITFYRNQRITVAQFNQ